MNFVCYFFPFQETQFQQKSDLQSQRQARSLTPTDGTPIISGIMKRNETSMLQLQIDQLDKHPHSPGPQLKYFGASWAALKKCFPSWRILLQLDYCMWWPGYCSSFFQASWPGVSIWIHISLVVISKSTSYLLLGAYVCNVYIWWWCQPAVLEKENGHCNTSLRKSESESSDQRSCLVRPGQIWSTCSSSLIKFRTGSFRLLLTLSSQS